MCSGVAIPLSWDTHQSERARTIFELNSIRRFDMMYFVQYAVKQGLCTEDELLKTLRDYLRFCECRKFVDDTERKYFALK